MIKKSAFRLVSASRTALFIVMITTLSIQPCQAILIETLPAYPIVDKDLVSRGNLVWLHQRGLTYDYQAVTTGEQTYRLGKFSRIEQSIATPTYLVLHDSENAAFDSGLQMVATQGGTLWVLENTENRNLYDYASQRLTHSDPNRMFWGLDNASSSLNQHSDSQNAHLQATAEQADKDTLKEPVKTNANAEFANYLLRQLGINSYASARHDKHSPTPILVALHNNRPAGNFGLDYIDEFGSTKVACQHDPEPKNLYWLATAADLASDIPSNQRSERLTQALCQTGRVNVVTEAAPRVEAGDGSLSIYMVNQAPTWQYVNIEIKAAKTQDSEDEARAKQAQLNYIHQLRQQLANP